MSDDRLSEFREFSDTQLLHALAFEQSKFDTRELYFLKSLLAERGLSDQQVADYRATTFPQQELDACCDWCGEELTLNREDLILGKYTCPVCCMQRLVPYPEIALHQGAPAEEGGTTAVESAKEIDVAEDEDAVSEEELEVAEDLEVFPEPEDEAPVDLPKVACHRCETEVEAADVYALHGNLYCEECYFKERESGTERGKQEEDEQAVEADTGPTLVDMIADYGGYFMILLSLLLLSGLLEHSAQKYAAWAALLASAGLMWQAKWGKGPFHVYFIVFLIAITVWFIVIVVAHYVG